MYSYAVFFVPLFILSICHNREGYEEDRNWIISIFTKEKTDLLSFFRRRTIIDSFLIKTFFCSFRFLLKYFLTQIIITHLVIFSIGFIYVFSLGYHHQFSLQHTGKLFKSIPSIFSSHRKFNIILEYFYFFFSSLSLSLFHSSRHSAKQQFSRSPPTTIFNVNIEKYFTVVSNLIIILLIFIIIHKSIQFTNLTKS